MDEIQNYLLRKSIDDLDITSPKIIANVAVSNMISNNHDIFKKINAYLQEIFRSRATEMVQQTVMTYKVSHKIEERLTKRRRECAPKHSLKFIF